MGIRTFVWMVLATVLLGPVSPAVGRIKLITLPVRERVEIQLDHANTTLVEEERIVPLVRGVNQVDFSWANTRIDPDTIIFRVVPHAEENEDAPEIHVLSVSYPPNEKALVWQVSSSASGSARVRISYILDGLQKSFSYRAVASRDESTLTLSQYMRLQNLSNEEFGESEIWSGFGQDFNKPIGINETREMLVHRFQNVPITKTYTCNPAKFDYLDKKENKLRVHMHYVIKNDAAHQLGQASLPYGKVRIFQEDSRGTTAFIGEDWGKFTPIDDEMQLFLGVAQDIVVRRTIEKHEQQHVAANAYHHEIIVKYEIENFKTEPVTLNIAEDLEYVRREVRLEPRLPLEWELGNRTTFAGGMDKEKSTLKDVVFKVDLPARAADGATEKVTHRLHVFFKNEW